MKTGSRRKITWWKHQNNGQNFYSINSKQHENSTEQGFLSESNPFI